MKSYQIETEEQVYIVIADNSKEALGMVREDAEVAGKITEWHDIRKGILLSYDYEDIYWR